jgi:hypothetical protein
VELSFSPGRIDPTNAAFLDSRKPLAGEFEFLGKKLIVVGNHFNSKGGDNPLFGRMQPPILFSEAQRLQQAQVVNDFVDSALALDPNANVLVIGDLNDFHFSAPLATVAGGVMTNLIDTLPAAEQYTYVFEGNSQVLDNFLVTANPLMTPWSFDIVHANAEFAPANRVTDHDPLVGRFCLDSTAPSLTVTASPNILWPANQKYTLVDFLVVVSDDADPNTVVTLVSVTSDEPDSGIWPGDKPHDIVIRNDRKILLRAERDPRGDGRVYTITYQAADACGNVTMTSATVSVPRRPPM